jgi:ABC-2 type transport system ATP-binding protein
MNLHADVSQGGGMASVASGGPLAIETHGLSKHFGQRKAVDALTINVPVGTIAGFVGPNGAGKTTTIRMLLGLVRPTAGSASVLGKDIAHPYAYLGRVGALIEAPAFYPGLSGRKNLEVLVRLGGYPLSRVSQLLDLVGLSDRASDSVKKYSLGMKQRLGVAMALLPDPDLLILDEPTNGLDPLGIIEMRDLLRSLRAQNKTIFISSHLLGELEHITDWLVMLNQGKAIFNGSASELAARNDGLIVEAQTATELDSVAIIVGEAGYKVTREDNHLRISCPPDFALELTRLLHEARVNDVEIRRSKASLEESFLSMVKGEH